MYTLEDAFQSLFSVNMGVRKGERILVFSDSIRPDEEPSGEDERRRRLLQAARDAADFASRFYGNASFFSFPATAASGAEPPENLWRGAFGDAVIDALVSEKILPALLAKQATGEQIDR
ncbi:MAG: peptidase, partial [Geobacteraceae bacterium]|nr:peptidase [Geobacteraceae bacterium]